MQLKKIMPYSIKAKYNSMIILTFFVLIAGLVTVYYIQKKNLALENAKAELNLRLKYVENAVNEKNEIALSLARMMASSPMISKAVAEQDKVSLKQLTMQRFENFKKKADMLELQFHTPSAVSIFRAHEPENSGDDLSSTRQGVVKANSTRHDVRGIEKGKSGFAIRGISPISHNGQHVGSVEFASALDDNFVLSLKKTFGFNVSIVVPDGDGFRYLAKTHKLTIPKKSYPWLRKVISGEEVQFKQVTKNNKKLMTSFGILKNFNNKTIGIIAIPTELTEIYASVKREITTAIVAGSILLVFLIFLVNFIFTILINRPLQRIIKKFMLVGKGDLTQKITEKIPVFNCAQIMQCNKEDCSCYNKECRCWETAGSFSAQIECPKIINGDYKTCHECTEVYHQARLDELQELSSFFNGFVHSTSGLIKDMDDSMSLMTKASGNMSTTATEMQTAVSSASSDTKQVAQAAETMSSNMNSVADASKEVSNNVSLVSTAADNMRSQFDEIAEHSENAHKITSSAVMQSEAAQEKVDLLDQAASEISEVTEAITQISDQTNLLALNATIEAARSGEAGKGFAVVAGEIKDLAKQTSESAQEIRDKIEDIQQSTGATIKEITKISEVINQTNEIVATITGAIDDQSSITHSISENVNEAAHGITGVSANVAQSSSMSSEITGNITSVSGVIDVISGNTVDVRKRSEELADIADKLNESLSRFKL